MTHVPIQFTTRSEIVASVRRGDTAADPRSKQGSRTPIYGTEERARELLRNAERKAAATAPNTPAPAILGFSSIAADEGTADDHAAVVELVFKHRLTCEWMKRGYTWTRTKVDQELRKYGHDARRVLKELKTATQAKIRGVYDRCVQECNELASTHGGDFTEIHGATATFDEMLAWVRKGPNYRYEPRPRLRVPVGGYWRPRDAWTDLELPSFPSSLVEWAGREFDEERPKRSRTETIEALIDLGRRSRGAE